MQVALVAGVNPTLAKASGIRSHVLGLGGALSRLGHEVTILGSGLTTPTKLNGGIRFLPVCRASKPSSYQFLASLFRRARTVPIGDHVLHVHRPDDLVPFLIRRDLATRVITVHGDPRPGIRERHGVAVSSVYSLMEEVAFRAAHRTIVLDARTQHDLRGRYPREARRVVRGTGGVDLCRFQVRSRSESRAALGLLEAPTIAYVGRLTFEKNLALLLTAFRRIPRAQLVVAGDGTGVPDLRKAIASRSNTFFLGPVGHDVVPTLLNAADVVALPSLRESMPAVCLEALACGTPVVATRVGALPDLIRSGENGFLSDAEEEALSTNLVLALDRSSSMRDACRTSVLAFGWDEVAKAVVRIYADAVQDGC